VLEEPSRENVALCQAAVWTRPQQYQGPHLIFIVLTQESPCIDLFLTLSHKNKKLFHFDDVCMLVMCFMFVLKFCAPFFAGDCLLICCRMFILSVSLLNLYILDTYFYSNAISVCFVICVFILSWLRSENYVMFCYNRECMMIFLRFIRKMIGGLYNF